MIRILLLAILPLIAIASESPAVIRSGAESMLADERARILRERTAVTARLQAAAQAADTAAAARAAAVAERTALATAVERRRREQDRAVAAVRLLADQAALAARMDPAVAARLPPTERATAAIAALGARIEALAHDIPVRRGIERIAARDGTPREVEVLRLGAAQAVALGDGDARGLLRRSDAGGGWVVSGPWSEPPTGSVVLDPDQTASTAVPHHWSLKRWLAGGRLFIWPILAVLAIGAGLAAVRLIGLRRQGRSGDDLAERAATLAATGHTSEADALLAGRSDPLAQVVRAGLATAGRDRLAREAALEGALVEAGAQLHLHLPTVLVLAGVAPLLGLLGTVTGMIDMFGVIAQQGASDARSLSGAISEALITTQAGMIAAIPLLLLHAWLHRLVDARVTALERAACTMLGIDLQPRPEAA